MLMHLAAPATLVAFVASLSCASALSIADVQALSGRASSAQLDTFCSRFTKACASSCSDLGIAGKSSSVCQAASKSIFDFACTCADSTVITTAALKQVGGLTDVKTKTKTLHQTDVVQATRTQKVTTTLVLTSTSLAVSHVSSTSTQTSYIYKPSSYPDVNRVAGSAFVDAYKASCTSVCKADKSTVKSSTCSLQSSGAESDSYKLACSCSNGDNLVLDALAGVGKKSVKPVTTSTRTVQATSTRYRTVTEVVTDAITAATRTRTAKVTTTSTSVIAGPTQSVLTSLTGRLRVDRLDRIPANDFVGFISNVLPDPIQSNPINTEPFADVDYSAAKAVNVTLELEPSGKKNAYAVRWTLSNGTDVYLNNVQRSDDELGNPSDCDPDDALEWWQTLVPFGPADNSSTGSYYGPIPVESYFYTLGESQPNVVHPERHIQVPINFLYVTKNGTQYVPAPVLAYGIVAFRNRPISQQFCDGVVSHDMAMFFEPDPTT